MPTPCICLLTFCSLKQHLLLKHSRSPMPGYPTESNVTSSAQLKTQRHGWMLLSYSNHNQLCCQHHSPWLDKSTMAFSVIGEQCFEMIFHCTQILYFTCSHACTRQQKDRHCVHTPRAKTPSNSTRVQYILALQYLNLLQNQAFLLKYIHITLLWHFKGMFYRKYQTKHDILTTLKPWLLRIASLSGISITPGYIL